MKQLFNATQLYCKQCSHLVWINKESKETIVNEDTGEIYSKASRLCRWCFTHQKYQIDESINPNYKQREEVKEPESVGQDNKWDSIYERVARGEEECPEDCFWKGRCLKGTRFDDGKGGLLPGISCYKIACALNEENIPTITGKKWEPRTIYRILRNPVYCGLTYFGVTSAKSCKRVNMPADSWTLLPDATPAIISKELFDRVQAALIKSKELHPGIAAHEYLLTGFAVCEYCGSPLVGSCMRGQYRYYHCRGAYPTTNRPKICQAHYIKADWLEEKAWDYIKGVLRTPEVLFTETNKQLETEREQFAQANLEQEIRNLTRKLKGYAGQERRLMSALRMEAATPDIVLDELNQMKKEREANKANLNNLLKAKESPARSGDFEAKVREFCARIAPDLNNCTSEDKKDAYKYLDLHIKAKPEGADIKGYVDPSVLMGGQSSGCLHALTDR